MNIHAPPALSGERSAKRARSGEYAFGGLGGGWWPESPVSVQAPAALLDDMVDMDVDGCAGERSMAAAAAAAVAGCRNYDAPSMEVANRSSYRWCA